MLRVQGLDHDAHVALRWEIEDPFLGQELFVKVVQLGWLIQVSNLRSECFFLSWAGGSSTSVAALPI